MQPWLRRFSLPLILLLALTVVAPTPSASGSELLVSAAMSLQEPLQGLGKQYEARHPSTRIHFNFASSGELARQIEDGAGADVFISAAVDQMQALEQEKLVDKDLARVLASNNIVIVVPKGGGYFKSLADLIQAKRLAVGDPAMVPAGKYAKQALTFAGIWQPLEKAHRLVFGENVKQVLAYVEGANVDAGIVYATDAFQSDKVVVSCHIDEKCSQPIIYCMAPVLASRYPQEAKAFLDFLSSAPVRSIFRESGFKVAP